MNLQPAYRYIVLHDISKPLSPTNLSILSPKLRRNNNRDAWTGTRHGGEHPSNVSKRFTRAVERDYFYHSSSIIDPTRPCNMSDVCRYFTRVNCITYGLTYMHVGYAAYTPNLETTWSYHARRLLLLKSTNVGWFVIVGCHKRSVVTHAIYTTLLRDNSNAPMSFAATVWSLAIGK